MDPATLLGISSLASYLSPLSFLAPAPSSNPVGPRFILVQGAEVSSFVKGEDICLCGLGGLWGLPSCNLVGQQQLVTGSEWEVFFCGLGHSPKPYQWACGQGGLCLQWSGALTNVYQWANVILKW